MAYTYDGSIKDYWPDDTDNQIYIESFGTAMQDLICIIQDKFGQDVDMSKIRITAENIHTHCLGYDSYDSSDWTDFLVITKLLG